MEKRQVFALVAALVVVAVMVFAAMSISKNSPNFTLENATKKKTASVSLEIANTSLSRMRGLMFREEIIPILFIFDYDGVYPIHSRFVKAEFDAIYLDGKGRVTEVFRKVPPDTNLLTPKKNARYLLELPPRLTDQLGIGEGDSLKWVNISKG